MNTDTIKTISISAPPDFELQIFNDRTLYYKIKEPHGKSKGLFFYIAGFASPPGYSNSLLEYISETFGYTAVAVQYHCYKSRPENGAKIVLTEEAIDKLGLICSQLSIPTDNIEYDEIINMISSKLSPDRKLSLKSKIIPPSGDYQNFGFLQALDHIYVINDLRNRSISTDFNNIVLLGTSHGGYIAHLINKLAPNTINHIIDNSSYVQAPPIYLGLGAEYNTLVNGNILFECSVKSLWDHCNRQNHPYYYDIHCRLIRDTANEKHLKIISSSTKRKANITAFNSTTDHISPIAEKTFQAEMYCKFGYSCKLTPIGPDDIDGKTFKTLSHGMKASMRRLCDLVLPTITPRETTLDISTSNTIVFPCYSANYSIRYNSSYPVEVIITKTRGT